MRVLLPSLLAFLCCGAAVADEVSGRVLDAEGRPVPGAKVALFWTVQEDGKLTASSFATTDGEGRYRYELPGEAGHDHDGDGHPDHGADGHAGGKGGDHGPDGDHDHGPDGDHDHGPDGDHDHGSDGADPPAAGHDHDHGSAATPPRLLFAVDASQGRGGLGVVRAGKPLELRLEPLVTVEGKLFVERLGEDPEWWALWVTRDGARLQCVMRQGPGPLSLRLPAGSYELAAEATRDHRPWRGELKVGGERVKAWLGEVAIEATPLARAFGRALPGLAPTEVKGLEGKLELDAYLGRWVLFIVFDVRAPGSLVPLLQARALCRARKDQREGFEVFALQRAGVPSMAALEKALEPFSKEYWDGEALPFPLLLDGKGETLAAWGVEDTGRMVLLDPDGRVVRYGDLELLRERLGR